MANSELSKTYIERRAREMKRTLAITIVFVLLTACTSAPTVSPTALPTATASLTATPFPSSTSTVYPTSTLTTTPTQTPQPTVTKTATSTATPTPEIKAPQYTITKYLIDSNLDDGTVNAFSDWTRNGDKRWQGETSYRQIIDDPTKAGKGKVAAFFLKGNGFGFDGKHRISLWVDRTAPGMSGQNFIEGAWGASVNYFFEPNHDPLTRRSDSRNLTIFEVFDVYERDKTDNPIETHIAVKLHMETNGSDNVITLYDSAGPDNTLVRVAQSKIPIKDGVWNNLRPMVSDDGRFFLFYEDRIDPDLNGVKLPNLRRVGVSTSGVGTYAGVDFVQSKGLTMYVDDVQLYNVSIK